MRSGAAALHAVELDIVQYSIKTKNCQINCHKTTFPSRFRSVLRIPANIPAISFAAFDRAHKNPRESLVHRGDFAPFTSTMGPYRSACFTNGILPTARSDGCPHCPRPFRAPDTSTASRHRGTCHSRLGRARNSPCTSRYTLQTNA